MSHNPNKQIAQLNVEQLLNDNAEYLIPMYQRNYAWGKGEIDQLIQDVIDCLTQSKTQPYYIGTLVVYKRPDDRFEVIDGQQRFTTLCLIAIYLNQTNHINLDFECREKSTNTFAALVKGEAIEQLQNDNFNPSIIEGYRLITDKLSKLKNKGAFKNYLFKKVQIMRVEVPQKTDLNHYFEIMNNRGEQLEKHEILKAKLLSQFNKMPRSSNALHKVWEACANMERYIQYGFSTEERINLFGKNWDQLNVSNFKQLCGQLDPLKQKNHQKNKQRTLRQIISIPPNQSLGNTEEEMSSERFNSVINFSNFLLHVLKVQTRKDVSLDDKQLIQQFDHYLFSGKNVIASIKRFIFALFKCKFMFDHYIIKREFNQKKEGWSLKRLKRYNKKTQSYLNSFDKNENDQFNEPNSINRRCLMLLAAFHVSTPTPAYKHWLNAALLYLYDQQTVNGSNYLNHLETTAKHFVFNNFLAFEDHAYEYYQLIYQLDEEDCPTFITEDDIDLNKLKYRNIENNFVFNYLDYVLWKNELDKSKPDAVITNFEFTFRSTVEHFYPQTPKDGIDKLDSEHLHHFGNLCLLSHSKNSQISNDLPIAKTEYFQASLNKNKIDSIKLYLMMQQAQGWNEQAIEAHGEEMIEMLLLMGSE